MFIKELQQFLNWYSNGVSNLVVDGVYGPKTRGAEAKILSNLKAELTNKGLKWDKDFNFIGIRTEMIISNKFNDWFIITLGDTIALVAPASTKAGLPAIWKYTNKWLRGHKGFGTIADNQEIDYLLVEPRKGNAWSNWAGGTGFLFQDKPINIYRDQNTDTIIDTDRFIKGDIGGAFNVHSWAGWASSFVQNLSEGCQVTKIQYWKTLFPLLVKQGRANNGRVKYKLIKILK